ncbi:MAG: T9SS type A sorting domain-containing protein [Chitinophagales bacterium]
MTGITIGNKGYVGLGGWNGNQWWEYNSDCNSTIVYADADGDGYGNAANTSIICDSIMTAGYVYNNSDCNDVSASIHPGAAEVCSNGVDENCNGLIDENCCSAPTGLTSAVISNSKAILHWNASAGAVKYNVRYKVSGNNPWKTVSTTSTSKTISGLSANTTYSWQVISVCSVAPLITSSWSAKQMFNTSLRAGIAEEVNDLAVYPNPFTSSATISFLLNQNAHITIELYDLEARKIQTLLDQDTEAGNHLVELDRETLSAGIYFLKIMMDDRSSTMKIMIQ